MPKFADLLGPFERFKNTRNPDGASVAADNVKIV